MKPYCVYYHKIDDNVVYVGVGEQHRPTQRDFRGRKWEKMMQGRPFPEVEIVGWFDDRGKAEAFEISEIRRLRPKANDKHNHDEDIQMRVPKKAYNLIRKEAFRKHMPMTEVLDEIIGDYFSGAKKPITR